MKHMFLLAIQGFIVLGACASFAQGQTQEQQDALDVKMNEIQAQPDPEPLGNGAQIQSASVALHASMSEASNLKAAEKDFAYLKNYKEVQESCAKKESFTTYTCLEKTSPQIAKSLPLIQAAISAMGAGVKDACSSFGKAMDLANKGLLAYQGACAASKAVCQSSCGSAASKLKFARENISKQAELAARELALTDPSQNATILSDLKKLNTELDKDLDKSEKKSVVAKNSTCSGYDSQLASAITGGIGVIASMGKANECDKKTTAANVAALAAAVDCTITANKTNNMTCICIDAPRTPGCAGGLDTALSAQNGGAMRTGDMAGYTPAAAKANIGMDDVAGGLGGGPVDGAAGTSGPGAPISGGKGVDGGSGGSGGGPSQANAKSGSGLNTNILGGEGGGGGGGYGSGGSDGNGLRQFLPKRDPAGNKLAGSALSAGVTAPGGKSNWEKVKERYRDNNTTLLGK
ncbi:MAG: hypothetical protein H7326_03850 [Bdellovibrionaceae bacterium]|nr:hypothetical protein [Pseudobdellovibrionaceae bacterium]